MYSSQDYYPFGMQMPSRHLSNAANYYRFGYNGQMKEENISVDGMHGVHNTAMFWEYDTRLARRWNVDPVDQVSVSNYAVMGNNPIGMNDVLGNDPDFVQDQNGKIKWDKNANSRATTQPGETYLGKELTFEFNSYIDGELWDGPMGSLPAGDKLTSTIKLTGNENAAGELTSLTATKDVKVGETPMGTANGYFPGLGKGQNKFGFNGTTLNFEQHASVSPIESFGLNLMGYNIVNVAQQLTLKVSGNILTITAATDVFPSATLSMNGRQLFQYNQPSFKGTHGRSSSYTDNGFGGMNTKDIKNRPAPSLYQRYKK